MVKSSLTAILCCFVCLGTLYGQHKRLTEEPPKKRHSHKGNKIQYGIASFYANKFNGRRTANGEIFDQKKLTAASNTLPLNTWVKVTNLRNKKSVIVKITDRMHWRNKRLIDLSRASAHQIGYTGWGLTRVKVEVLGRNYHQTEPLQASRP